MIESNGMLRHLAFFEELGKMDETDPSWRSVSAGLVTMRLVDQWIADGPTVTRVESWGVSAVREAIAQVAETDPVRRILSSVVDTMVASTATDLHGLCPRLMAYGQALDYEQHWSLAADVYATIAGHVHPVEDADLAVASHLQLAYCQRVLREFDDAAASYERASRIALAAGDMIGVLRGRLGDAKLAIERGNMPEAEVILDDTIARADQTGLEDIRSRALHERAYLSGLRGQHDRAVRFAYQALELSPAPVDRDRILTNIATGFRHLGLTGVARDAYLVLANTAREQYSRWVAELNLMELAADDRMELEFDRYRRDLESANFLPLLRVTYLLHVGRGYHALGNSAAGIPYLEQAVEMAAQHRMNRLVFEAEAALGEARRATKRVVVEPSAYVDSDVQGVIDAIHQMKFTAGIR